MTAAPPDRLIVVLSAVRNPLNIGAAARAMSNFGFSQLRVVAPYDVAFREARSAVGAPGLLKSAEEFLSVSDAVSDCGLVVGTTAVGARELLHPLKRLEEGGPLISAHLENSRVALLFGSEKRGLSKTDLSHCHWLMRIPTQEAHRSMNLGQAVAVCLYELVRTDHASTLPDLSPTAKAGELERLTQALFRIMLESGYAKPGAEPVSLEKARRLVRRMMLNDEDARTWTGILAKARFGLRRKTSGDTG